MERGPGHRRPAKESAAARSSSRTEIATLLGSMALVAHLPKDAKAESPERAARTKAADWLKKQEPTDTTQAAAYRLLFKFREGATAKKLEPEIADLLKRQNKDGGFAQVKDLASDAYATGQSLYVLGLLGVTDRPEIRRSVDFLVATQKEDGSWPMTRRSHPGVTPGDFTGTHHLLRQFLGNAWPDATGAK